jgi:ATP-binding cassette, subfamily C, bacterial PrsD
VVLITHRPATLRPVSHLAIMQDGTLKDFGLRDEVLQRSQAAAPTESTTVKSAKIVKPAS